MDKMSEAGSDWDSPDAAWPIFTAIILGLLGVFNIIEGLLTLLNARYIAQIGSAFFFFNLTGWGWLHLLLGLVLLGLAAAMFMGFDWAPSIAVGMACLTAIFGMIYVNIIPTWSWVNVALAVLLIYVLVVKGLDMLGITFGPQPTSDRTGTSPGAVRARRDEGTASPGGDVEP